MSGAAKGSGATGLSPFDTPSSSTLRFVIEVTAWVAGTWAAVEILDSGWAAVPALAVLLGLPSVFNVAGDKNVTGILVPGLVRILIEGLLLLVAVGASWYLWPTWAAVIVLIAGAGMIVTGLPRYRWLASGAPSTS